MCSQIMEISTGTLCIRCADGGANCSLQFLGAEWSETHPSIEAAIRRAGELVVEETRVVVYDSTGVGVVVTTLFPPKDADVYDGRAWAERLLAEPPTTTTLATLKAVLATGGLREAVKFLNRRTKHRFTSLYQFDGPALRKVTFYDREHPDLDHCEEIPVEASYCVFVREKGQPFVVEDSRDDARVAGHPKRSVLGRYCGVPLLDASGKMFGSICHFDFVPGRVEERDVRLLERMAELLSPSLNS